MSEENSPTPEPAASETTAKSRVRRVSNPRPKKTASVKTDKKAEASAPAEASLPPETAPSPAPAAKSAPAPARENADDREVADHAGDSAGSQEWPEPETISEGSSAPGEGKRKRRRRKGKGGQNSSSGGSDDSGGQPPRSHGGQPSGGGQQSAPQPAAQPHASQSHQHSPRVPVDPETLAKKAWKIYLSEVSEEGIALINDHDAKELSRRCFRLAEIFLDEQSRRIRQ